MRVLRHLAAAVLAVVGSTAGLATAEADSGLYLEFGAPAYRHDDGRRHLDRVVPIRRFCTPNRALDKAERLGFRRVDLERVGRDRIVVSGRRGGEWREVVFARDPGCPVIRIR